MCALVCALVCSLQEEEGRHEGPMASVLRECVNEVGDMCSSSWDKSCQYLSSLASATSACRSF